MFARTLSILVLLLVIAAGSLTSYEVIAELDSAANPQDTSWYDGTVWSAMRSDFTMPTYTNQPAVQEEIRWFQDHRRYLYHVLNNSRPYIYYVYQQTKRYDLPAEFALLPVIESQYNPIAYSSAGAEGLWQMMPGTASGSHLKTDRWYDGRRDVIASTKAALSYLTYLHTFFDNNWLLALAAYDSGDGTVQNAIYYNHNRGERTDFWALPLPLETQSYVPKMLALIAIISDPSSYGIRLPNIPNQPYLKSVKIDSQINITTAAKLADISVNNFKKLNPALRHNVTDPNGPYTLLVPANKATLFNKQLIQLGKSKHSTYMVKTGDSLSRIAHRYRITVNDLQKWNNIHTTDIKPGQQLRIIE